MHLFSSFSANRRCKPSILYMVVDGLASAPLRPGHWSPKDSWRNGNCRPLLLNLVTILHVSYRKDPCMLPALCNTARPRHLWMTSLGRPLRVWCGKTMAEWHLLQTGGMFSQKSSWPIQLKLTRGTMDFTIRVTLVSGHCLVQALPVFTLK